MSNKHSPHAFRSVALFDERIRMKPG